MCVRLWVLFYRWALRRRRANPIQIEGCPASTIAALVPCTSESWTLWLLLSWLRSVVYVGWGWRRCRCVGDGVGAMGWDERDEFAFWSVWCWFYSCSELEWIGVLFTVVALRLWVVIADEEPAFLSGATSGQLWTPLDTFLEFLEVFRVGLWFPLVFVLATHFSFSLLIGFITLTESENLCRSFFLVYILVCRSIDPVVIVLNSALCLLVFGAALISLPCDRSKAWKFEIVVAGSIVVLERPYNFWN